MFSGHLKVCFSTSLETTFEVPKTESTNARRSCIVPYPALRCLTAVLNEAPKFPCVSKEYDGAPWEAICKPAP